MFVTELRNRHRAKDNGGRAVGKVGGIVVACLAALVLALSLAGIARANSTSVDAASASATVFGSSLVPMSFALERTGDSSYDTWLHYETRDSTAVAGTDYEGTSGDLLIPAGATEASIPVQTLGAAAYSPDKQFTLELGAAGVGPSPAFAAPQGFATGEGSNSIASTDVNGDGRRDLLVANGGEDAFSVLLNTTAPGATAPSYAPEQTFAAGRGPRSATAADVNGDGRPDLIVVNNQIDERAISVFLNTTGLGSGTASFSPRQVIATGDNPRYVQATDLNGDGRPDVVFSNQAHEYVSVLMNTTETGATTLSFIPQQSFGAGENTNSLQATDVNGDGRPDLVVANGANQGKQAVSVLLNTTIPGASTPSFAPQQSFAVQGATPRSVATADFNGDGRPDLVVASQGIPWVSVLLNTTEPGASIPSFAPQHVVPNLPSGFKEWVTSADFNGDGKSDLALVSLGGATLSVLFNTTPPGARSPSFSAPQNITSDEFAFLGWVTATDVNGDGRRDLLVANNTTDGKVSVLLNATVAPTAAAPSFAAQQPFATGEEPSAVSSADLNGDGRPDLLTANEGADNASVLLNTTAPGALTPTFAAQQAFATGGAPTGVTTADLNGDGKPDLVVANHDDDTASVLFNTTAPGALTPTFAAQQAFATGGAPTGVTTADLNGDGKPDLVVANHDDDNASVLLNTTAPGASAPSFAAQQAFATGGAPSEVTTADLNGDGVPDLIVANGGSDNASVLFNTTAPGASTPSFAAQQAFATGEEPSAVKATDLNGDGVRDFAVANEGADTTSVLFNTTAPGASTPSFTAQQTFATGGAPTGVTTTDLNGDGVPDLLLANHDDDTASGLLNTTAPGASAPSFAAQQAFATGGAPSAVTTADLNGDGGPDVVAADDGSDEISVLLDTQYAASVSPASVTGTIHYAIPQATLSPVPLAFGEQVAGTIASKTKTVSNTGGAELAIKGIAIGGADAAEFSQQNSCPPTLAMGASCSIGVTFAPNAAAVASAVLTVTSNAPSSPDTVALSGIGTEGPSAPGPPPPNHTLSVTLTGGGKGSIDDGAGAISCPSTCSHAYANGTTVTLTAIPARGSRFAGWSGGGCTGARTCQLTIGADTTLSASFEKVPPTPSRPHVLVSYRQEGGIGGPRPALVVSRDRKARVTLGRCTAKFELRLRAWRKLRAALRDSHLHTIAGNYPAPKGSADVITYVIKASGEVVRIAPAPQPENEEVMRDLESLLKVLNKTVSTGERRMPPSC